MIDIDKLEALEKAATPGPWINDSSEPRWIWAAQEGTTFICGPGRNADADLLVAVRNSLPELLAEVRRLRQVEEGLENIWEPPD